MESGESLDYVHHFLLTVKPRINQGEDKKRWKNTATSRGPRRPKTLIEKQLDSEYEKPNSAASQWKQLSLI